MTASGFSIDRFVQICPNDGPPFLDLCRVYAKAAERLGLAAGAPLFFLERVRLAGEELGIVLLVLAFITALTAYRRWALNERAIRLDQPLPSSRLPLYLSIGVAIVAIVAGFITILSGLKLL